MRIISGEFGGRKLVSFKGSHIRPTTDRTKESIFNKLRPHIQGARVLDLFSGTGSLGLEALSRQATSVEMVENHPKSLAVIRKNVELLGVEDRVYLVNKDVIRYCQNYKGPIFDIILIDPPFLKKIAHRTMLALAESKLFSDNSIVIIESGIHEQINEEYLPLLQIDKKEFSDKRVCFYGVSRK